ncbi:UNVERIFIED_ORG: flagellar assembly protein FliW [Bacillus sp. AZ43]
MTPSPTVLAPRPPAPASAPARPVVPEVPAVQVLSLTESILGFPDHRDYVLVPAEDSGRMLWLQSAAPDGPRFLVVSAAAFFPDYAPALPGAVCAELGLSAPADARLYCIVTVPDGDVAAATANLRAPVVVDPVSSRARQVVLLDAAHPIRRPLRR